MTDKFYRLCELCKAYKKVGSFGSLGLAGIYFIFSQMTADIATTKDLEALELKTSAKIASAEHRVIDKLDDMEDRIDMIIFNKFFKYDFYINKDSFPEKGK